MHSNNPPRFFAKTVSWPENKQVLYAIRHKVFVEEQNVSESMEWDKLDDDALHFLAYADQQEAVGTARLLKSGKITRMAVLSPYRNSGAGSALLASILDKAKEMQIGELIAEAQITALGFYEKHGFKPEGEEFYDAGILHKTVRRPTNIEQTNPIERFESSEEANKRLIQCAERAKFSIHLFSRNLDHELYDDSRLADALSRLVRSNPRTTVKILVENTRLLSKKRHRIVQLHQRISSRIYLLKLDEEWQQPDCAFLISDKQHLVYFNHEENRQGFCNCNARAEAEHILIDFEHYWTHYGIEDINLRRLSL